MLLVILQLSLFQSLSFKAKVTYCNRALLMSEAEEDTFNSQ